MSGGRVLRHALTQPCTSLRLVPHAPLTVPSPSTRLDRPGPSLSTRLGASIPGPRLSASGRVPAARTCPRGRSAAATARPQPPPHAELAGGPAAHRGRGEALSLSPALGPWHSGLGVSIVVGFAPGDLQLRRHGAGSRQRAPQPPWPRSPSAATAGPRALGRRPRPQPGSAELLCAAGRGSAAADQRERPVQRRLGGPR